MPRKTGTVMRSYLVNAPTPQATATYTVISHRFVIDNVLALLAQNGFQITAENYTANQDAKVATGIYHVEYGNDPDLGMLFAFANSYDKTLRFQCAVGAYVKANGNSILNKNAGAWVRKHTGTSDQEAVEAIESQIKDAAVYFDQLKEDKDKMKLMTTDADRLARFVGSLFFMTDLFTSEQMSIVRSKFHKHNATTAINLWDAYNDILSALAKSHPRTWMNDQKLIHMHMLLEFDITNFDPELAGGDNIPHETLNSQPVATVDPNQIDLVDMIEEVEAEQSIEAHVETDEEYNARVAEIEGEPTSHELDVMCREEGLAAAENIDAVPDPEPTEEEEPLEIEIELEGDDAPEIDFIPEDEVEIERVSKKPMKIQDAYTAKGDKPMGIIHEEVQGPGVTPEAFDESIPQMPAPDTATDDEDTSDDLVVKEEEVTTSVEDVLVDQEFFMDKADLDDMHPDMELEVGMVIYIGDDSCEITSIIENDKYGLKMVTDEEEELLVESIDDTAESLPLPLSNIPESMPMKEETQEFNWEVQGDLPEPQILGAENQEEEAAVKEALIEAELAPAEPVADLDQEEDDDWEDMVALPQATGDTNNSPIEEDEEDVFEIATEDEIMEDPGDIADDTMDEAKVEELMESFNSRDKAAEKVIASEIEDIYGAYCKFTYTLNGDQYNVKLETGETIVLLADYVENMKKELA